MSKIYLFFFKFSIYFILSFLILSVPISDRPIFFYLYEKVSPYSQTFFNSLKKEAAEGIKQGKQIGKNLFEVDPKVLNKKLESPPPVENAQNNSENTELEEKEESSPDAITDEERALIEKVLKKAK
jgi:hypothetical protein